MKKVLILVALCISAFSQANAQYSPEKGDFAVEFGVTPFAAGGDAFKLNEGMLKARYFVSSKDALRLKLGLGIDSDSKTTVETDDPYDKTNAYSVGNRTTKIKNSYTDFSFMLGYERHLYTKGRFDVYAGIELGYGFSSASGSKTIEGSLYNYDSEGKLNYYGTESKQYDYFNQDAEGNGLSSGYFNGNIFVGFDVYVWKNLYLGAECGLNFKTGSNPNSYSSYTVNTSKYKADNSLDWSETTVYDGATNTTVITTVTGKQTETETTNGILTTNKGGFTNLGFYVEPAIRIGWRF